MLHSAVKTLQAKGLKVQGIPLDVTLKEEWLAAAQKTLETFGKVHMLVAMPVWAQTARITPSGKTTGVGCWM